VRAETCAVAKRARRGEGRGQASAAAGRKRPKRRVRAQRSTVLLRWCMVGVAALVGVLYYHPLTSYVETRSLLNERSGEVAELRAEKARLEARLERSGTLAALSREARQMNLVRPGERLYIVKGIPEWRRAQRTMRGDG
jgi:Septum formation initiator